EDALAWCASGEHAVLEPVEPLLGLGRRLRLVAWGERFIERNDRGVQEPFVELDRRARRERKDDGLGETRSEREGTNLPPTADQGSERGNHRRLGNRPRVVAAATGRPLQGR